MKRLIPDLPKHVLISLGVLIASLLIFGILTLTLGGARDNAIAQNGSLQQQITRTEASISQSEADRRFVLEHQEEFEGLVEGDQLVPHTRRAAVEELQRLAVARGLTSLNYSFQAAGESTPEAVGSQPASDAFKVSLEQVTLKLGAPFDGPIYRFVDDLSQAFPGSAIVQSLSLNRQLEVTDQALQDVSQGRHSRLVEGTLLFSWRTAQAAAEDGTGSNGQ